MAPQPQQTTTPTGTGTGTIVDPYTEFLATIEELRQQGVDETVINALISNFISATGTGTGMGVQYGPREAMDPAFAPAGWSPADGPYLYDGPYLVDYNGQVLVERNEDGTPRQVGTSYIPVQIEPLMYGSQAYVDLVRQNPDQAAQIIETLEAKGFQTGTIQQNVRAFQALVQMGVDNGTDWQTMYEWILENQPDVEGDETISIPKVTSVEDLKAVASRTALDVIGRELTPEEANRFAYAYRGFQTGYYEQTQNPTAQMAVAPPDPTVYAEKYIGERMPDEERAYAAMNRVETLFNNVRSRF